MHQREPLPTVKQSQAITRWKSGHHLFHVYLVVMNTVLDEVLEAIWEGDARSAEGRLRELASLYDAASAAMKYAADFEPGCYTSLIRPSMQPPLLSEGFSGTLNKDHALMLFYLRSIEKALEASLRAGLIRQPSSIFGAWELLRDAEKRNRRHHGFVCQRFVPNGVSLLQQSFGRRHRRARERDISR